MQPQEAVLFEELAGIVAHSLHADVLENKTLMESIQLAILPKRFTWSSSHRDLPRGRPRVGGSSDRRRPESAVYLPYCVSTVCQLFMT